MESKASHHAADRHAEIKAVMSSAEWPHVTGILPLALVLFLFTYFGCGRGGEGGGFQNWDCNKVAGVTVQEVLLPQSCWLATPPQPWAVGLRNL